MSMNNMYIIGAIAPLYNQYQQEKDPVKSISIMWKTGKILDYHIKELKIKPHTLFRDLYGKSESSQNTEQKSYVSREFQGRCYRVFHMFKNIDEIEKKLKNLKSVTVFREAMPFFDNEKYKIDREDLYQMLTSDKDTKAILQEVKKLQNTIINKKNPRTQRLSEMKGSVEIFKNFYQYILSFIRIQDYEQSTQKFTSETGLTIIQIRKIAKNTEQLVLTNVVHTPIVVETVLKDTQTYVDMLNKLLDPSCIKELRRFKRLVNSRYILLLTDMLYALTDKDSYQNLSNKLVNTK